MYSEQEQFAKESLQRIYGFIDSDYELTFTYGRNAKSVMASLTNLYKQFCGNGDASLTAILNLTGKYCKCDVSNTQLFHIEEELLKAIDEMLEKQLALSKKNLESLKNKTKLIFSDISEQDKNNLDVRKNDLRYIINQTSINNLIDMICCLKMYFDGLIYGLLPAGPLPESEKDLSSEFTAKQVPVFTHEPVCTDIPLEKEGPFFDGLRTLAETDPFLIRSMFRDCDNGKVYVRLYDPDNDFAPDYIDVEKVDACYQWIINEGGYCNWPGFIISALQTRGLDIDSDPEDLFGRILGSKIKETDISDFCTFSEDKIAPPGDPNENKIYPAYKNCGLALYASLLLTNSNMIEDPKQYLDLLDALQEYTVCFALPTVTRPEKDAAMKLLKHKSDNYRAQGTSNGIRSRKRILVCDAIDTLYEFYTTRPNDNPLEIIRAKYPQLRL